MKKLILATGLFLTILNTTKSQTSIANNTNYKSTVLSINQAGTYNNFTSPRNMMNTDSNIIPVKDASYYFEKSKDQKTTGWVLGIVGAALIGGAVLVSGGKDETTTSLSLGYSDKGMWTVVLGGIGGCFFLASIPCFISSGVNKHKGRIALSTQKTGYGIPAGSKNITGLSLAMPLGK